MRTDASDSCFDAFSSYELEFTSLSRRGAGFAPSSLEPSNFTALFQRLLKIMTGGKRELFEFAICTPNCSIRVFCGR